MVIDPHYETKHRAAVDDRVILQLVKLLDGGLFPVADRKKPFEYFVTDRMSLSNKLYKLVWLLEDHEIYIGVVNAYRRR